MTRLFYEQMIKTEFPYLQWIRICTIKPYTATVYACDANLELNDETIDKLQNFLSERGMLSCLHEVKHYFELQNDQPFPIGQVPSKIATLALKGDVTQNGVIHALQEGFSFVDSKLLQIDKNVITFYVKPDTQLTQKERKIAALMLSEIVQVGSTAILSLTTSNEFNTN